VLLARSVFFMEEDREYPELLQSIAEFFEGEIITLDENPFEVEEEGYYECSPVENKEIKERIFAVDSSEAKKKMLNLHPKYFRHGYVCRQVKTDDRLDIDAWYLARVLNRPPPSLFTLTDWQITKEPSKYRLSYLRHTIWRFDRKKQAIELQYLLRKAGLLLIPLPEWREKELWKFWSLLRSVLKGVVEDARKSNLLKEKAETFLLSAIEKASQKNY